MTKLPLDKANKVLEKTLKKAAAMKLNPLAVSIVDSAGQVICMQRQDGASDTLVKLSQAKAYSCTQFNVSSRTLGDIKPDIPEILGAAQILTQGNIVAAPGGVIIRDGDGVMLGAVGVSGDTSDNDETCAKAGIEAAGFTVGN